MSAVRTLIDCLQSLDSLISISRYKYLVLLIEIDQSRLEFAIILVDLPFYLDGRRQYILVNTHFGQTTKSSKLLKLSITVSSKLLTLEINRMHSTVDCIKITRIHVMETCMKWSKLTVRGKHMRTRTSNCSFVRYLSNQWQN